MTKHLTGPVGLFIPCYVDQFYPDVGLATVEVLERLGVKVEFPDDQSCCGQPMVNAGCVDAARPLAARFVETFARFDHIVCPSGSCVSMVRHHYEAVLPAASGHAVGARTFELTEFLTDVLGVETITGSFPHRVGLHQSCHGLRDLRLAPSSELVPLRKSASAAPGTVSPAAHQGRPGDNKARRLLSGLNGISFAPLERPDECCGFGGTFAVSEEAVSCLMGEDRLADHEKGGAEVLTAGDMSCLMHLDGLLRRKKRPMAVMHLAQILAGRPLPPPSGGGDGA